MAKAWRTFSLVAVVVLVSSLVAAAAPTVAQASPSSTGDMEFTLYAGDYEIVKDDGGLDVIQMEGFSSTAEAGNPTLPQEVFNIAVPPDIDWESLQLEVISAETETLDGTYDIGPAALPVAQQEGGALVDGKNPGVYGNDADFPENYVSLLPYSQMRKWSFTRVDFTPFQYNPVSGELTLIESVTIAISYERTGAMLDESLLADTAMDDIASETFLNYEDAKGWYEPELALMSQAIEPQNGGTYDYVIITTNVIEAGSTELANFVAHKTSLGFTVLVITEDEYSGLAGEPPDTRAERIRQWLINNYSSMGIQYVLLIGDPTPGGSGTVDVPMQMCHPEANNSYDDIVATPTDYYYADLTGDWDYDNDTLFGEWVDDYPVGGGVDFTAEVYVGRIPVYSESYTALDSILDKVITYETDTGDTSWRQNILLPMGFQASGYDGANLGQQMKTNYLDGAGYSSWRMYQQSEADPCSLDSTFPSEEGLNGGTSAPSVYDRWTGASGTPNDFGIVCWWAHGSATSASVGYSGCWDGTLFQSSPSNWCTSLDDSHPAFTYQCSCLNGYPENSANLQYSILANGGIATVSASRVSWFYSGETDFTATPTNSGIGYHYVNRLVNLNPAGQALYDTKAAIEDSSLPHWLMNWCDFNLYGDPAVSLEAAEGEATHDFGDAPDPNYPTLLANNGARHLVPVEFAIWMGPSLVNNTDLELDGQPTNLDDAIGIDDEDGVTFYGSSTSPTGPWSLPYIAGDYGRLDVEVNGTGFPGCLHAWIDFNQDGDWDDAGENILCSGTVSSAGIYQIVFNVPADAVGGTTWARFRLDEEASCLNSPVGEATNGEVEDYPVVIGVPDIRVDPTEFCLVLPPDSGWGAYLRIYNDGDTDLDYSISEAEVSSSTSTELPPGISVVPLSEELELPPGFEYSAIEPESPVSSDWEWLMMEGFEGTWPGIWNFYIDGSDAYWGQETYRANGPTHSAYCAKNGTLGVAAPGPYPNGMFSWMFAGPYNLEDAIAAEWSFSFWLDSEDGADNFYMMVSTDGYVYSGWYTTGDSGGWVDVSLDLSDVPYVGDCRGELEVYVAFIFESDGNATSDEGAYVDDVGLRYDTGCDWLNVLPNSGSVPPGEYDDLLVTVDTTGLMPSSGGCPSCSGGEPESSAGPIDVLLVAADSNVATVQTYLSTFADIATVDIFNANGGTPALSLLQSYDSVLVWSNATFDDPAALGDVLADYVDSGGCVTVATFAWTGYGASLEGRFETGLYDPFVQVGATLYSWADLGLYNSSSPLMSGVTSITGYFRDAVSLASGATLVASWDDGYPFVAHKGRVIGVNLFPAIAGTGYDWTGDVPTLFHNALIWCSSYLWCGDTCCEIVISSNDPDEDPVIVPVCVSIAIDYGDAPDPPYPSLRANDGARHYPGSIWLGTAPTAELDSLQVDLDTHDDGVTFLGSSPNYGGPFTLPYARGQWGAVQVEVNGTGQGCVHGWIDWNDDGDWDDTDENVFCSEVVSAPGTYTFVFSVPVDAVSGQTWSRFRLDYYEELPPSAGELESAGVPGCMNSYTGLALDGEVEDYPVNVEYIPPEGWSSDDIGVEVNAYCEFEDVYTTGSGFAWDTGVDIYVVPDQAWSDGMSIPADVTGRADVGKDTSGTPIWTDINGDLGPVCIWLAPVDPGDYDIVFDANKNGVYDALIDYVDHPNHPGFVINECPFAAFIASPVSGSAPLTVQFVDQSTGYITSWLWYFGDGTTSAAQHPSHVYNYGGAYTVTLTVTGPCGTDVATGYIEVIEEVAPARIIVRNLLIEPANALPGQQVVISADVVNQGGIRGSKRIDLVINGYAEQAIRVGVDPGAAQHITFYTSKTVPGTYEVFIEGQASAFNVFIRPRVTTSEGFAGGLSTAAIITIVVIAVIFLVGLIIVFMRVRR